MMLFKVAVACKRGYGALLKYFHWKV